MLACIDCFAHAYNGILNLALLRLNENFEADFLQLYQAEFSLFPALHLRKVKIRQRKKVAKTKTGCGLNSPS